MADVFDTVVNVNPDAPVILKFHYRDGSVEARRDYVTKYANKRLLGRPILAEVWGKPNGSDMAALRAVVDPRRGKVVAYDD